jgi:uncharacterized delta-60 repeat protein
VTVQVNDGANVSSGAVTTIAVTAVNDAPVNTVPDTSAKALTVTEDANLSISGLRVTDIDAASGIVSVTLSVNHGTVIVLDTVRNGVTASAMTGNGTDSVTLTGTLAQINLTLAHFDSVVYQGDANFSGTDTLTMRTNDGGNTGTGGAKTDTDTVAIKVKPVNDAPIFANPGDGGVQTDFGSWDFGRAVAVQPDGKILVAGTTSNQATDFALARYNADGSLDTSFGTGGKVTTDFSSQSDNPLYDTPYSVIVQPDGKILMTGYSGANGSYALELVRYNADGSLDTSFGSGGRLITDALQSVTVQPDGKILVTSTSNGDFALVRYNADGSLDTSFSGDGKVTTDINVSTDFSNNVTVQPDGKILVVGYTGTDPNYDVALVRYNVDGSLDTSFSSDGKLTVNIGFAANQGSLVTVQPDGKILLANFGSASASGNNEFALARYNADGSLDTSFTGGGKVTADIGSEFIRGASMNVQPDGKVLVAGYVTNGSAGGGWSSGGGSETYNITFARYNVDGSLDTSFSGDGKVTTNATPWHLFGYTTTVQSDGKILVVGTGAGTTNGDFQVLRYNADGSVDTSFNTVSTLGGTVHFTEGGAPVVLDADVIVTDAELDALGGGAGNYDGASLTITRSAGASAQDVFSASGTLGALTEGASLTVGSTTIGAVTSNADGTLVLTFNSNATTALVSQALRQIAYANNSDAPPASVKLGWTFSDGNTAGAQGTGGEKFATGSVTVKITAVNDAPTGTDATVTVLEDGTKTFTAADFGFADVKDSPANTLAAVKISTLPANGELRFNGVAITAAQVAAGYEVSAADIAAGKLTFVPESNPNGTGYVTNFTFQVRDNGGTANGGVDIYQGANTITIDVASVDRPLSVTNPTVSEGSPYAVFTVTGKPGQLVKLELTSGTATVGTDTGDTLQYFDGTKWVDYTAGTPVAIPTGGTTLLVRTTITGDSVYEGQETFTLKATNTGGTPATGTATIRDDGQGDVYPDNPTGATDPNAPADDDRPLSVTSPTVSESSPYVVFTVTGESGQLVKLELTSDTATVGTDTGDTLQYFNGSAWVDYTAGTSVAIPADGTTLLVRTTVTADSVYEGPETVTLKATNTGGTPATGTGTIRDDGQGDVYPDNANGATDPNAAIDDDRPLSVTSPTVSESSPYVVFTVTGESGQLVKLELTSGSATVGTDTGDTLQYFDGTNWVDYTPGTNVAIPTGGMTLLVRTTIIGDSVYEGLETFTLKATNTGGTPATGTATLRDDGQGDAYPDNATGATDPNAPADDDRPLSVTNPTVSEGSPYAVFTVTGEPGQLVKLELTSGTATVGTDTGDTLQYFNGTNWVNYTAGTSVAIPADGTTLLVRTTITGDSVYEGQETFTLKATNTGGTAGTGTATIRDDGQGDVYPDNATGATDPNAAIDDDRPLSVTSPTVSESSPYVVFTVTGESGQLVKLELTSGTATVGIDTGDTLQYFNGSAWVDYTAGTSVAIPADGTTLLVRTTVTADSVYEGPETVTLSATSTGGTPATGTATLRDDGQGDVYPDNATGATDPNAAIDDDRPLSVTSPTVSESSPYVVFTVTGEAGQLVKLELTSGTATVGTDTGDTLQYFNGTNWVDYTPGTNVAIPTGGTTLLVRTTIIGDSVYEGPETFTLKATNTGGTPATGTATLRDDGTSTNVFYGNNHTGIPTQGRADDDRPQPVRPPETPHVTPVTPPAPLHENPFGHREISPFDSTLELEPLLTRHHFETPLGEILTRSAGFQVAVIEESVSKLTVFRGITDQFVEPDRDSRFTLPYDAFMHTRSEATVLLDAKLLDGTKLPEWMQFDSRTGNFRLAPPKGFTGEFQVKITARDNQGHEAVSTFRLFVGDAKHKGSGRHSMSEQIKLAAKRSSPWGDIARAQDAMLQAQRQQMSAQRLKA